MAGKKAPAKQPDVTVVKPKQTPPEWGMLKAVKEIDAQGNVNWVSEQLDDAVLMEKSLNYIKTDSDGNETPVYPEPLVVFIPKSGVDKKKQQGFKIVEDAPHWRFFALKESRR